MMRAIVDWVIDILAIAAAAFFVGVLIEDLLSLHLHVIFVICFVVFMIAGNAIVAVGEYKEIKKGYEDAENTSSY